MIHALSARLIGVAALLVAAGFLTKRLVPLLSGDLDLPSANLPFFLANTILWVLLGVIFLVPSQARRTLRTRVNRFPRVIARVIIFLLALLILFYGIGSLKLLGFSSREETGLALLGALVVLIIFVHGFIYPGNHAMALAMRFHGLDDHVVHRVRTGPRANPDDDVDHWRDRAMAQHFDHEREWQVQDKARRRRAGLAEFTNPSTLLFVLSFLLVVIGVYGGAYAHFLPDAAHMAWALETRWPTIIGGTAILTLAVVIWPAKSAARGPTIRLFAGIVAGGAMWTFISAATIPHGLPALHSLFVKDEPTTLRVRIVQVGGEINRRRCNRIVYVRGPGAFDSGKRVICDVPRQIWETAQVGQSLTLIGHRSPYGLRYDEIRR